MKYFHIVINLLNMFALIVAFDFCKIEKEKCNGKPHIACSGHDSSVSVNENECTHLKVVPMDRKMKLLILREHNRYRNQIASGKLAAFPSASRMKVMCWSNELEATAEAHVKRCAFAHDKCRATSKWEYAGQNLAIRMHSHEQKDMESIVEFSIRAWWEEYMIVPEADSIKHIESLEMSSISGTTGHFFVITREINSEIGCALISYRNDSRLPYNYLFTCNYPETNMQHEQVYDIGLFCSRCEGYGSTYSCDKKYKAMCQSSEHDDEDLCAKGVGAGGRRWPLVCLVFSLVVVLIVR